MYSTQAWAAHYGLPLNAPEDFVQGYADGMRLDAKGQGKPCGRGFIPANKKCSAKGSQQLAADLKAGDAKAKARVARGKQNAMAQQAARRQGGTSPAKPSPASDKDNWDLNRPLPGPRKDPSAYVSEFETPFQNQAKPNRKRSPESVEKQKATREENKARREKLWGSKANTPKRLQRQTVKIEGGKVRRTRAIKGRSSTRAKLYKPE